MTSFCESVQARLADGGDAVLNEAMQEHLASCPQCTAFAQALRNLDSSLAGLPEYDAADSVVEAVIATVEKSPDLDGKVTAAAAWLRDRWGSARQIVPAWVSAVDLMLVVLGLILLLGGAAVAGFAVTAVVVLTALIREGSQRWRMLPTAVGLLLILGTLVLWSWGQAPALTFLEGAVGAAMMVAASCAAVFMAGTGQFRGALGLLVVAIGLFIHRSMVSTFFNDVTVTDGAVSNYRFSQSARVSARQEPSAGEEFLRNTRREAAQEAPAAPDGGAQLGQHPPAASEWDDRHAVVPPLEQDGLEFFEERFANKPSGARQEAASDAKEAQSKLKAGGTGSGSMKGEEPLIEEELMADLPKEGKSSLERRSRDGILEDREKVPTGSPLKGDLGGRRGSSRQSVGGKDMMPAGHTSIRLAAVSADWIVTDGRVAVVAQASDGSAHAAVAVVPSARVLSVTPLADGATEVTLLVTAAEADEIEQYKRRGSQPLQLKPAEMDQTTPAPDSANPEKRSGILRERYRVAGLRFQSPHGYWANTYLPGDPHFRELLASISAERRRELAAEVGGTEVLDELATRPVQPFDEPAGAALALYLHSDVTQVNGPTRMLLQVGLQASSRQVGSRPPLTMAFVFDLSPGSGIDRMHVESVLRALLREMQAGDLFTVAVAGRDREIAIEPRELRHGTVTVALDDLFSRQGRDSHGKTLVSAFESAAARLRGIQDPNAVLGSGALVLLTGREVRQDVPALSRLARESALAGIQVNVISVGAAASRRELDTIALAGQGTRRVLATPADADSIVAKEIAGVSSVVARAVRLNIRLASGVRLVEVIGSRKLDLQHVAQVREAERGIDRRIERTTGIRSDRGEDEDGIQIVIPAFYSGDSHVVLLDVVASTPGAVAQVTAKYKDLVYLRNGSAKVSLSRGSEPNVQGPLELNVVKNFLGFRLSETLRTAGATVARGETDEALALLSNFGAELRSLSADLPLFRHDSELLRDGRMLTEYLAALRRGVANTGHSRTALAQSLLAAGKLKVLPRPVE